MHEDHVLTCFVCRKAIPEVTTFISVSVMREHMLPDGFFAVSGFAENAFQ